MGIFEQVAKNIIPIMIKGIGVIGIIIIFSCIIIGIYKVVKKKEGNVNQLELGFAGFLIWLCSLLIDYSLSYDPFSSVKLQLPLGFILSVVFLVFYCMYKGNKKKK